MSLTGRNRNPLWLALYGRRPEREGPRNGVSRLQPAAKTKVRNEEHGAVHNDPTWPFGEDAGGVATIEPSSEGDPERRRKGAPISMTVVAAPNQRRTVPHMDDITHMVTPAFRTQVKALLSLNEEAKKVALVTALADQDTGRDIVVPVRIRRPLPQNN